MELVAQGFGAGFYGIPTAVYPEGMYLVVASLLWVDAPELDTSIRLQVKLDSNLAFEESREYTTATSPNGINASVLLKITESGQVIQFYQYSSGSFFSQAKPLNWAVFKLPRL